jgi:hypothetical protein
MRRGAAILAAFILLIALWRKAHIKAAGWLLLAAVPLALVYHSMPTEETAPAGEQRTARANVKSVSEFTQILETSESPGVETRQPFQIVELQFVPEGRTDPVIGVDKIDSGSIRDLAQGSVVPIRYQVDSPRILRITGATRTFPREAQISVARDAGEWLVGIVILLGVCKLFDSVWKGVLARYGSIIAQVWRSKGR